MTNKEIGEMIKTRRISRGMTQDQLADAIGVSPSAVGMYESGRRKPKDNIVEALADVFNVSKWSILYREDEIIVDTPTITKDELTLDERRLLAAYRAAEPSFQKAAIQLLELNPAVQEKENRA